MTKSIFFHLSRISWLLVLILTLSLVVLFDAYAAVPPTDISLDSTSVAENAGANAVVGNLSSSDPDAGETFTYPLASGTGDTDNASFNINSAELRLTTSADYETQNSYSVRIRSTDSGSLTYEEAFTITVTNDPSDDVPEGGDGGGTAPTPTPTPEPTPDPTPEPTPTRTLELTDESTGEPTDESTDEPTQPPMVVSLGSIISETGELLEPVSTASSDGKFSIVIEAGTTALDAQGNPLTQITIQPLQAPPGSKVLVLYDLGPDGATFDPPEAVRITMTYDPDLPDGVEPKDLVPAYYDPNTNTWMEISGTIFRDYSSHTITFTTAHLTQFGILANSSGIGETLASGVVSQVSDSDSVSVWTIVLLTLGILVITALACTLVRERWRWYWWRRRWYWWRRQWYWWWRRQRWRW